MASSNDSREFVKVPFEYFSNVQLRNFRGFKSLKSLSLKPLTFLVGPNSSGKSSLFDALLFLAQSRVGGVPPTRRLTWTGRLVDLGSYQDTVHGHKESLRLSIRVVWQLPDEAHQRRKVPAPFSRFAIEYSLKSTAKDIFGETTKVVYECDDEVSLEFRPILQRRWAFCYSTSDTRGKYVRTTRKGTFVDLLGDTRRYLNEPTYSNHISDQQVEKLRWLVTSYRFDSERLFQGVQRIASGRASPRRWYSREAAPTFVPRGGNVFDEVGPWSLLAEDEDLSQGQPSDEVRHEIADVLKSLDIASDIRRKILSPYHASVFITDSKTGVRSNLIDVGYGASQAIPVIRGCLSGSSGPLLVEQPEIHLHPKAQGVMAELLCRTASRRQVIVETHSEHMINRARIQIARGELASENCIIHYVSRTSKGTKTVPIRILPNGEFDKPWPAGFFDERFQDSLAIIAAKEGNGLK